MKPLRVTVRLEYPGGARIGPGKAALLEAIGAEGSIAAAARRLGMSYPRALALLTQMETLLGAPVAVRAAGGARGGGASLTALGARVAAHYRAVEAAALDAAINRDL